MLSILLRVLLVVVTLGGGVGSAGCGATPRQVAHVSIVSTGSLVAELERESNAGYVRATDALRISLHDGGTLRDYVRLVEPYDTAHEGRARAIAACSAALYAAAAINDASGGDPAEARRAAGRVLRALELALDALDEDAELLGPVHVPPEIRGVLVMLGGLAGPLEVRDGG